MSAHVDPNNRPVDPEESSNIQRADKLTFLAKSFGKKWSMEGKHVPGASQTAEGYFRDKKTDMGRFRTTASECEAVVAKLMMPHPRYWRHDIDAFAKGFWQGYTTEMRLDNRDFKKEILPHRKAVVTMFMKLVKKVAEEQFPKNGTTKHHFIETFVASFDEAGYLKGYPKEEHTVCVVM